MGLELSSDQVLMRDEAVRLLAERADAANLRRAIEVGAFDAELWKTIGGTLGWCAVAIPEDCGGLGRGTTELVLLAEQTGRRLAPVPFWTTACVAAPVIAALADEPSRTKLLGRIAAGDAVAMALADPSLPDPFAATTVRASQSSGGYLLEGQVKAVFDLASARVVIVPSRLDDGSVGLFALTSTAGFAAEPQRSLDLTQPIGALTLDRIAVSASTRIDRGALRAEDFLAALLPAKLGLAAEQIGAAQGCLDITLAYVAERRQFGRPIASFQVVKHRCAELFVEISEARSLLYGTAASLDRDEPETALEIAAVGALGSRLLFRVAEELIQLHGGAGNTWEYDPHLYLRRAQMSAFLFGRAEDRLHAIADALFGDAP